MKFAGRDDIRDLVQILPKETRLYLYLELPDTMYLYCKYRRSVWHVCCCCCCFSHSAQWLPTRKKLLYTVANPARGLLNRKKKKKEVWQRPPPPPPPPRARCSFGEKNKKIKKSRDASTCLGATQVGVTQVVSVRLASVQGFLRLVS